jgi:hypothetical protein
VNLVQVAEGNELSRYFNSRTRLVGATRSHSTPLVAHRTFAIFQVDGVAGGGFPYRISRANRFGQREAPHCMLLF